MMSFPPQKLHRPLQRIQRRIQQRLRAILALRPDAKVVIAVLVDIMRTDLPAFASRSCNARSTVSRPSAVPTRIRIGVSKG
jgi:hypothetical protein